MGCSADIVEEDQTLEKLLLVIYMQIYGKYIPYVQRNINIKPYNHPRVYSKIIFIQTYILLQ